MTILKFTTKFILKQICVQTTKKTGVYHQNCYSSVTRTIFPQVLGFAAFFALVLKKVDQEEFGEPQLNESLRYAGTFISRFLFCSIHRNQQKRANFPSQILTRCARWEETARAAFISHRPPLTSRGWETTWLKSRKCSLSYGKSSVRKPLCYLTTKDTALMVCASNNLPVVQHTQALCGCCFWWHMVRGTPTLSFWPSTSGRASAKTSRTAWAFRMCSTGPTRPCWATCLGNTQVRLFQKTSPQKSYGSLSSH